MKWLLVAVIVAATSVGEVLQSAGMKHHGEIHDFRPGSLGRVVYAISQNWMIILSVCMMAVSFFAFMELISVADLSFAVPATAASYVLETILAKAVLKEKVGWRRWAGGVLVCSGVALVSF
jgi:drug/metabolite transporter (DMT)-like permease